MVDTSSRHCTARALLVAYAATVGACSSSDGDDKPVVTVGPVGDGGKKFAETDAGPVDDPGFDTEIRTKTNKYLCGYDEDDFGFFDGNVDFPNATIARSDSGFGMVFWDRDGNLRVQGVDRSGYLDDAIPVVSANQNAHRAKLAASGGQFVLATSGPAGDGAALKTRSLTQPGEPETIHTGDLSSGGAEGNLWDLIDNGGGFVLAFLDDQIRLQRLHINGGKDGEAVTLPGVASRNPRDLHLARIGPDVLMLAWYETDDAGIGRIMGQRLDADLNKDGGLTQLSKNPVSKVRFDLTARELSAGLIYENLDGDVRDAVKYRRLEADGMPSGPILNIVPAPKRATGSQIADFGQGYAVAYRILKSLGAPVPEVRLAFVNQYGDVVHDAMLARTSETAGPVSVGTTADGYLLVTWTQSNGFEAQRAALKLYCPGALLLCGGEIQ